MRSVRNRPLRVITGRPGRPPEMPMSQTELLAAMFAAQKGPVPPERMRAAMETYFETWRRSDIDARLKLFVDEPVVEDPVGTPAYRGREAVRAFWKQAAWPGVEFNADRDKLSG